MSSPLAARLKEPEGLLAACKGALPSWRGATLAHFTSTAIEGGYSSPGLYLTTCSLPDVHPSRVVIKLEPDSKHLLHPLFEKLDNSDGPYQGRISRELGEVGLGPRIFHLESDKNSPYWGLMAMEELPDGGFVADGGFDNVSADFMKAVGSLLGSLHLQPTLEAEKHANLTKQFLLESQELDEKKIEKLFCTTGGCTLFLVYWWKTAFPNWMKANSSASYPLSKAYTGRVLAAILDTASIRPLNPIMGKLGFSHLDLWHGNLMKQGEKVLAIDCETCSIGPAFFDFGGILYNFYVFNGKKKHMAKNMREALAISFFDTVGEKCENMDEVLYDLELSVVHWHIWNLLGINCELRNKSSADLEEIGGFLLEKADVMVKTMKKAVEDKEVMEEMLEKGVYWASRHLLSEENEEKISMFAKDNNCRLR